METLIYFKNSSLTKKEETPMMKNMNSWFLKTLAFLLGFAFLTLSLTPFSRAANASDQKEELQLLLEVGTKLTEMGERLIEAGIESMKESGKVHQEGLRAVSDGRRVVLVGTMVINHIAFEELIPVVDRATLSMKETMRHLNEAESVEEKLLIMGVPMS